MPASSAENVMALLERHLTARPDAVALRWVEPEALRARPPGLEHGYDYEQITWRELDERIRYAAAGLWEIGLRPGDRALLFVPMSVDLYVAMFAVFRLGAVAVFLDSFARQHQLEACALQADPKAYFGNQEAHGLRMMLPEVLGRIPLQIVTGGLDAPGATRLDAVEKGGRENGRNVPVAEVAPETTALVTFTTGSSGAPKGANRTHGFLHAQHVALDRHIPYEADDSDVPAFPIFLLNNMAVGITTVIPAIDLARPADTDPERLLAQLMHGELPCATISPALIGHMARHALDHGVRLDALRRMITGGAPVGPGLVRDLFAAAPNADLMILYGSTEAEPISHVTGRQMLAWLDEEPGFAEREGVCVGWVDDALRFRIVRLCRGPMELGEAGWGALDVARGEPGELLVAGEHVCRDYFRNEEAFARAKVQDGETVWHRTGDVGRLDEQGRLWLVGRVHNAILRDGRALFPVSPEQLLRDLPFVRQGAYVGLADAALGERACVAFSTRRTVAEGEDPLARGEAVRKALEEAGVVADDVVCVERIPMDPRHHSKVDYDQLRALLEG